MKNWPHFQTWLILFTIADNAKIGSRSQEAATIHAKMAEVMIGH